MEPEPELVEPEPDVSEPELVEVDPEPSDPEPELSEPEPELLERDPESTDATRLGPEEVRSPASSRGAAEGVGPLGRRTTRSRAGDEAAFREDAFGRSSTTTADSTVRIAA